MLAKPTIQYWLNEAKAGEGKAWSFLFNRYYPGVYATALQICGNTAAARDAVQDAFVTAFLKLEQLKDPEAFGSWLQKIVMRKCYQLLSKKEPSFLTSGFPHESDGFWDDEINRKFDQVSTQSRLYTALANLPEKMRGALMLRYFSNYHSYEQIAAILGTPVGTIRSRLSQAKAALVKSWEQYADPSIGVTEESREWNEYYYSSLAGMHWHDTDKNKFINHLERNVQLILTGGLRITGGGLIDGMVTDDRRVGSWFTPRNVQSCGNMTIVEAKHFNPVEHPHHCPDTTVLVLYREKGKVGKLNLHFAPR